MKFCDVVFCLQRITVFIAKMQFDLPTESQTGFTEYEYGLVNGMLPLLTEWQCVCLLGDITDAKLEDREGSRQFEDEWKQYDQALCESGILDKTIWLDTRGNHGRLVHVLWSHNF